MLHLHMCTNFIGRVGYTGLYLVVLLYASLCSVVLQDVWPWWLVFRTTSLGWLVFGSIAGQMA